MRAPTHTNVTHPQARARLTLVGACACVCPCSSLHYFSIRLNSISVVNLVLALGLSVDYAAHIAHRFVESASEEVEHGDDDEGDEDDAVTDGHTSQLDAVEGGGKGAAGAAPLHITVAWRNHKAPCDTCDCAPAAQKPALPQTAADRVERAMWVLGASVFNGGWSTFMAIFPLFLTSSTVSVCRRLRVRRGI